MEMSTLGRIAVVAITIASVIGANDDARAQSAVTTFGSTDARLCYEDALSQSATAVANCDKALRDSNLTLVDRRATRVNRGIILNRKGYYNEAIAEFDAALSGAPDLAEALLNRGNSYFLLGQHERAIADYQAALAAGLRKAHVAWYNIGLAREAKKDKPGAVEAYRESLRLQPDFAQAREKVAALDGN